MTDFIRVPRTILVAVERLDANVERPHAEIDWGAFYDDLFTIISMIEDAAAPRDGGPPIHALVTA